MTHDQALALLASLAVMYYDKYGSEESRKGRGASSPARVSWAQTWSADYIKSRSPLVQSTQDNIIIEAIDLAMSANPNQEEISP